MTKKELEKVVAEQAAQIEAIRAELAQANQAYNGLGHDKGEDEIALKAARKWALEVGNKALEANRAAYKGDLKAARKATWELLGLFPKGQQKARELEAARKAASNTATPAKKEIDTSDLV